MPDVQANRSRDGEANRIGTQNGCLQPRSETVVPSPVPRPEHRHGRGPTRAAAIFAPLKPRVLQPHRNHPSPLHRQLPSGPFSLSHPASVAPTSGPALRARLLCLQLLKLRAPSLASLAPV